MITRSHRYDSGGLVAAAGVECGWWSAYQEHHTRARTIIEWTQIIRHNVNVWIAYRKWLTPSVGPFRFTTEAVVVSCSSGTYWLISYSLNPVNCIPTSAEPYIIGTWHCNALTEQRCNWVGTVGLSLNYTEVVEPRTKRETCLVAQPSWPVGEVRPRYRWVNNFTLGIYLSFITTVFHNHC